MKGSVVNKLSLRGTLRSAGPGTWTRLPLDRPTSSLLGSRAKVRVRGKINGHEFETTAVPNGDGTHSLLITKSIQTSAGVKPGTLVDVTLEVVRAPRPVTLPLELRTALSSTRGMRERFEALAPSHRRAWAEFVAAAKAPATRVRRAAKAIDQIRTGKRDPKS
jgi:Domain of unknown function (DUF1905)/Bacteriocin-protection, YdeI or OmpD-Associated